MRLQPTFSHSPKAIMFAGKRDELRATAGGVEPVKTLQMPFIANLDLRLNKAAFTFGEKTYTLRDVLQMYIDARNELTKQNPQDPQAYILTASDIIPEVGSTSEAELSQLGDNLFEACKKLSQLGYLVLTVKPGTNKTGFMWPLSRSEFKELSGL